jgi:hypothetical protein
MDISQGKVFYNPEPGTYLATIIDIIDKPQVQTQYGPKNKVLVKWVISQLNGQPYLDPEGQPFQVMVYVTATLSDRSTQPLFRNLYKVISGVLNGAQVPLITSTEQLEQLLLGRSNTLMVMKEPNPAKAGEFFTNVVGILPLPGGAIAPQAPAGFVRFKNKPKTQAGPQGRPVQTYAQPQQLNAPAPANTVSFAQPATTPAAF